MKRILAVVRSPEVDLELLEEAGAMGAAAGVEVVVVVLINEDEPEESIEEFQNWDGFDDVRMSYPADTAIRFAEHLGKEVLAPLGTDYLTVGERVESTQPSEKVIDIARNHDCDHIYIGNGGRSPARKALFGNTAQSVILNFEGFVTVQTV